MTRNLAPSWIFGGPMPQVLLLDRLRRSAKELRRSGRAPLVAETAARLWLMFKAARDLLYFPSALLRLHRDTAGIAASADAIFNRYGGLLRPYQNRNEILRAAMKVAEAQPEFVVEIGTAKGGTLLLWSRAAADNATLISVDLPGGMFGGGYPVWKAMLYRFMMRKGQALKLIRANSHSQSTVEKVKSLLPRPADVLFIDADHTYEGVKTDFNLYRPLVRAGGLIILHDILPNTFDPDIDIAPFWAETKAVYECDEIVDDYQQGCFGIGVVSVPH
jgi:predicted O-methyltransferase YrrM